MLASLILGFVLLVVGGESLVRGAVATATRLGLSPLFIGIVLVGFGTSTPELVTSVQAALAGSPGIAVGNIVGSNIANILLILGVGALLLPMACHPGAFYRDGTVLVLSAAALGAVVLVGALDRWTGLAFVAALLAYVAFTYVRESDSPDEAAQMHEAEAALQLTEQPMPLWLALLIALAGIALTIVGARLLVSGAIELATAMGVSETLIGLTVVAVGTSLPELVTAVIAALKKEADVAFGNIVGSNIYNTLGILGITATVQPLDVPREIADFDIWVMLAATVLLLFFAISGWRVSRREGAVLLALYAAYVGYLAWDLF
ncbi:MAG TPA: calcium/sodium antiporter [Geminicoccaceae bacterium]|nr:calcium/sodium antiporter [Geminicoccaceae bacterium]